MPVSSHDIVTAPAPPRERTYPWLNRPPSAAAQRPALIEAAFAPGAKVARVGARADIRPSQIYRWRRDLLGAANMGPVVVTGQSNEPVGSPTVVIELQGATVRVMAGAAGSLVTAVLRALRR